MTTPRPNRRRRSLAMPLVWIAALAFSLAAWAGLFAVMLPTADGTDTGVGCIDDCLDPIDTTADAEPIRAEQEEAL